MTTDSQIQIPAELPIRLEITAQDYANIVAALDEIPGKFSRPIIQKLDVQAQLQLQQYLMSTKEKTSEENTKHESSKEAGNE